MPSDTSGSNVSDVDFDMSSNSSISHYEDGDTLDDDYVPPEVVEIDDSNQRRTSRMPRLPSHLSDYQLFMAFNVNEEDPVTVQQAMSSEKAVEWKRAMDNEYQALIDNQTWNLVELPEGCKAISSKWVYKTKVDSNGKVDRHKARLVVKGCAQRYGVDYHETFSPVVRYSSIRLLIALAVRFDLEIDQMDAVSAFLQGNLDEKVYMVQPECYDDKSGRVCLLKKSLYGLKQASRVWNQKLDESLKTYGLKCSDVDNCIYFNVNGNNMLIVAVYVDDLMIFSSNAASKNKLKSYLHNTFHMKDLGEAKYILGIKVTRDRKAGSISIDQSQYIRNILERFRMFDCNPISTPADLNQKLTKEMSPKDDIGRAEMSKVPYQEAVGSLLYAAQVSRPDIQFAVTSVSRFNNDPGAAHWMAVKRIMRYLKGTINYQLTYSKEQDGCLTGFCDADWAGDLIDRRSTSGYVFVIQGSAISWASKKQKTVALSTVEAEYMSMAAATQEALWLRSLLNEILGSVAQIKTVTIKCDNKGAIQLSGKTEYSPRTKHIDVRHHFLKEKVKHNIVMFEYINTANMIADNLTKAVNAEKTKFCNKAINLEHMRL